MKINFLPFLLISLLLSSGLPAMNYLSYTDQASATFSDSLKKANSVLRDTTIPKVKKEILRPIKFPSLNEAQPGNLILSGKFLETIDYR
ncbi:MAG: hypothetical protein WC061_10735, partial [Melioribacteraceae bacterium]